MHEPEYERYWLGIWVLPEARRHGLGSALYAAASDVAREAGKTGLPDRALRGARGRPPLPRATAASSRPTAARWSAWTSTGCAPPDPAPPAGIRLVTLAERPDLRSRASTRRRSRPSRTSRPATSPSTSARWTSSSPATSIGPGSRTTRSSSRSTRRPARWSGYASLLFDAGSTTVAYHDMTAVRRAYRGRGIAGALKRATIAWAIEHGLEALDTGNDERQRPDARRQRGAGLPAGRRTGSGCRDRSRPER